MRSIIKATAVLGSASVVNILTGLVSAKISAVLLGPGGVGYMGLLQSLLGLAGMVAGMGVSTGFVRDGARALAEADMRRLSALRAGAWLSCGVLGVAAAVVMVLARVPLSRLTLGGSAHGGAVIIIAVGLLLTLAAGIQTGILNAHRQISALVRCSMLGSVLGTASNLLIIWTWRGAGVPWAVLAGCFIPWAASAFYLRRLGTRSDPRPSSREVRSAAGGLLRFGAPFTASLLVGAGVVTALPVFVLHAIDADAAGYYRAAATVAVSYLGFVTASMSQDYYPRVSAVADQKAELCRLVNEQHRLVLLLGGPVILGMLALVPYLIPLVYSPRFIPAVGLLEWQLLGDMFRLAAWTMAFVILARSGSFLFFGLELAGGASLLGLSWVGMRWFGLEGLGMGFVACAVVYYLLCWIILRRTIGLRWTARNVALFLTLVLFGSAVRALPYLGFERARTPVALLLAAVASAYSVHQLWGEMGGFHGLLTALRRRLRRTAPRASD